MAASVGDWWRQNGAWGVALGILRRIPGVRSLSIYYVYHLQVADLEARAAETGEVPDEGLVVLDGRNALEDMVAIADKRDLFTERLASGDHCMVCYCDGKPVGYVWSQSGRTHREERLGFLIEVDESEMYCYDIFVLADYRRLGVAREMTYGLVHQCQHVLGKRMLTAIIEVHNKRSIRANEKIGWRRAHRGLYAEAFGRTWYRPRF